MREIELAALKLAGFYCHGSPDDTSFVEKLRGNYLGIDLEKRNKVAMFFADATAEDE
jgi:hypothetical protein